MLKTLTGQSTHGICTVSLSTWPKKNFDDQPVVSEIAYELGFEHLQSFSKLFKTQTSPSPLEFRNSFN